jgi:cytidyltransferase-like protein
MVSADVRKVFVTGCFDMLHSGHVAFLVEAARHGKVHVGIGSDENVRQLKGRYPVNTQEERRYMLEALRCVASCSVNAGWGLMDFTENPDATNADIFFVNEDGNTPEKEQFCRERGIEYIVSKRIPNADLPARSTTGMRLECSIPFRIDLAGGWLDQPFVSRYHHGSVVTISIEPTIEFNDRSGMASSTRWKAVELWHTHIPGGNREKLAKTLFCFENPPGTKVVSGSQDALGIVFPGLNRFHYEQGEYWPAGIESIRDEKTIDFIERHLALVTLEPRHSAFSVLDDTNISREGAKRLADAANDCWNAILARDLAGFGKHFTESFEAQRAMFPRMADETILGLIDRYRDRSLGWKLSGAGGGGYLILVTDREIEGTVRIRIRREGTDAA